MTTVLSKKLSISTIPLDLSPSESIRECIEALSNLQMLSEKIFTSITTRIEHQEDRLEKLSTKIGLSETRISSLKSTTNPLTVYSPADHPALSMCMEDQYDETLSVSVIASSIADNADQRSDLRGNDKVRSRREIFDLSSKSTVCQVINRKDVAQTVMKYRERKARDTVVYTEGLGKMFPRDVRSVSSFVEYKKDVSPYLKSLETHKKWKNSIHEDSIEVIGETEYLPKYYKYQSSIDLYNYDPNSSQRMVDKRSEFSLSLPLKNISPFTLGELGINNQIELITPFYETPEGELPTLILDPNIVSPPLSPQVIENVPVVPSQERVTTDQFVPVPVLEQNASIATIPVPPPIPTNVGRIVAVPEARPVPREVRAQPISLLDEIVTGITLRAVEAPQERRPTTNLVAGGIFAAADAFINRLDRIRAAVAPDDEW